MRVAILFLSLLISQSLFADLICQGRGLTITVFTSSSNLRAEIRKDGRFLAETSDVSDISAFDIHYIGNFKKSSFDLVAKDNGVGRVTFDNFIYSSVPLNCSKH
jgi:hypothetical protein